MFSAWEEILFNFLISGQPVTACDEGCQFGQLFRGQFVNSFLNFGETHEKTWRRGGDPVQGAGKGESDTGPDRDWAVNRAGNRQADRSRKRIAVLGPSSGS
jgi:hypothetical protein